jgi:hypothetical protein
MTFDTIKFTEELFSSDKLAWLQLDVDVDIDSLVAEIPAIDPYFVPHRKCEEHKGWSSCCLHGMDIDKTEGWENYVASENEAEYRWTALSALAPNVTHFWKNIFPVESYYRVRFMKLDAGGYIAQHRDCRPPTLEELSVFPDSIAINLAITQPQDCTMAFEDHGTVPWTPGSAIMLDVSKIHSVQNLSNVPRVHMIAHAVIGNRKQEFCDLIYRSYQKYAR